MSEKVRKWEPYPWINYVKCPKCGEETKIVERTTDLEWYAIICKEYGRIELPEPQEMKAHSENTEDRKAELAKIESDLPQFTKKKTGSKKDE